MKKQILFTSTIIIIAILFSSCQAIGDIFKAGVWVGVVIVVAVIALIAFIISKAGNKN
jgi:TRAP-type C4-dicarboxylate transport system permease large subunit